MDPRRRHRSRTRLLRLARLAGFVAIAMCGALLSIAIGDALYSTTLAELRPWHTARLQHEFRARQAGDGYGFDAYLAQEQRLFDEVAQLRAAQFDPVRDTQASRYAADGGPYARRADRDWNRSYVLQATPAKGVALLIHGLSDSPYALRSVALALQRDGVTVYGLRLPGHGTIPGALDHADWHDWLAAVGLTVRQIRRDHPDSPFWMVGFSTGATLALKHTADAVDAGRTDLLPRRLILLSPALGVSPFAPLANVQRLLSRWGVAQKARWANVGFEIDPFKYESFAKNAGAQIASLIRTLYADLDRMDRDGSIGRLPPILTFQSMVDATVSTPDLAERFYGVLRGGSSELVLFDVNRAAGLEALLTFSPKTVIEAFHRAARRDYRLTVVQNAQGAWSVVERSWPPGGVETDVVERPLPHAWPAGVFSLSHVALPIAPDDPIYGLSAPAAPDGLPSLGALALRGERGVLAIAPVDQLRLRSNPFFGYVIERIAAAVAQDAVPR
jgi:alpha-beta hydrolase superfamily lysophospholipase